jgi:DNA-binding XRE family transcriptional regulator
MARDIDLERQRCGEILRNLRIDLGYTQNEVALEVSSCEGPTLSRRHYRRMEKGECTPSATLGCKIANLFGVLAEDIWG